MYFQCPGRYMVGTLSMSLQCICSVPAWYTTLCPQCLFHAHMSLIWAVLSIHRGSFKTVGSLAYFFNILDLRRLGSARLAYYPLLAAFNLVLDGLLLDCWAKECGCDSLKDFKPMTHCHRAIFHVHFSSVFSTLLSTHSFIAFTFPLLSLFSTLLSRYRLVIRLMTLTNFYDLMTIPFILFLFFLHTLSFDEMRT